jgi:hypothetical protein
MLVFAQPGDPGPGALRNGKGNDDLNNARDG